jgi:thymidine phosphorylase
MRDVTSTVECIPLITASILSKKIAEGINGLVMDVKCGHGAFMKTRADARELAESLVRVGTANGLKTIAVLTAMDVPLGRYIGNSLEVIESADTLRGQGPRDLTDLSVLLAARMVKLAGLAPDDATATQKVRIALDSGAGFELFLRCIEEQGGDPRALDDYSRLPTAPRTMYVVAPRTGFVAEMTAGAIGVASMILGGGRERAEDGIDHAVGIICRAKPGERVLAGQTIYEVYYRSTAKLMSALPLLEESFTLADAPPPEQPILLEEITIADCELRIAE